MEIEQLLQQIDWRIRAFLGSPSIDPDRLGWRRDSTMCVAAEWLYFELIQSRVVEILAVDADCVWADREIMPTPAMLTIFIDLLDAGSCAADDWSRSDSRVALPEVLAALALAERLAAQRLLPERAANNAQCAYVGLDGQRCVQPASTPWIHAFLRLRPTGKIRRRECREFAGCVCDTHWSHIVAPPDHWWHEECHGVLVVPARRPVEEREAIGV